MNRTSISAIIIFGATLIALAVWMYTQVLKPEQEAEYAAALQAGIDHFNSKDYWAALDHLRTIPAKAAGSSHARYYEGSTYIMLKDYQAALAPLEEGLLLEPGNTGIMHALGVAHFKLGHLGMARAYFAEVLEVDPTDAEAKGLMDIMARLERAQGDEAESQDNEG